MACRLALFVPRIAVSQEVCKTKDASVFSFDLLFYLKRLKIMISETEGQQLWGIGDCLSRLEPNYN